ncbi:GNAT family N-acetyltransferase [Leptolyngbya sp. FACHB-711]|jgi:ribosomal protein S18 acetylase RimI-like enzyme|uniref:GNAT family N-acetyltransferase n=1 Tax=unclassified Leptolyngbya TaxID=2650499 RepID=UPI0016853D50|nr:GNAT family N-acetyltransferase [Leptolyngbya sp. FACHB-711]MBD1849212.1 GNAT family N-acetyltransferase [Cyanobacteria bacterium FACHB-502]
MLPVQIRPATTDDRSFILSLVPRFVEFGSPTERDPDQVIRAIAKEIDRAIISYPTPQNIFIAVDSQGKSLGFIFLETLTDFFTQERHAHISDIVVIPEASGQGIGQALMAYAETWAKARSLSFITLNAFGGNGRARSFYSQLGYQEDTVKYLKRLN